jgi:hypothetical protein
MLAVVMHSQSSLATHGAPCAQLTTSPRLDVPKASNGRKWRQSGKLQSKPP